MSNESGNEEGIDWKAVTAFPDSKVMSLKEVEIGDTVTIHFLEVKQVENRLVATVDSEDLEGNTLWLKGDYGPQNGLMSLIKACGSGEAIEGSIVKYTKVPSEKSPAGYAHHWSV